MPTDYTRELTITGMVFNRLTFLEVNGGNTLMVGDFIWEIMNELEWCFQIGIVPMDQGYSAQYNENYLHAGDYLALRVGKEENYSVVQRSIIANLAAAYILAVTAATNSQGGAGSAAPGLKYLKKAKAGSAEVEWGEFDIKKSGAIAIGGQGLIDLYTKRAALSAAGLGCILDVCNDCNTFDPAVPFIVVRDGCGC